MSVFSNYIIDIGTNTTAWIYIEGNHTNTLVYNNVLVANAPFTTGNALATGMGDNVLYANNTHVGWNSSLVIGFNSGKTNASIVDNLFYNVGTGVSINNSGGNLGTCDTNVYYGLASVNAMSYHGTFFNSLLAWISGTGFDLHSTVIHPSVDFNYIPTATDTILRGTGVNLSPYFTMDRSGNPRPATGAWDIGAYQYTTNLPGSPSNLRIVQ